MKLLHRDASPEALAFVRLYVFGLWFLSVLFDPLTVLSALPLSAFEPAGFLLRAVPDHMKGVLISAPFLYALKSTLLVSLALAAAGLLKSPAMLVSAFLLTIYQGIVRGFGHINHADMAFLYAAYFLAFFDLADRLRGEDSAETGPAVSNAGLPLLAAAAFMLLTYMYIGVFRIVHGGAALFSSDTLKFWMVQNGFRDFYPVEFKWPSLLLDYPVLYKFLKASFPILTLFEIFALFALVSRPFRVAFLLVIVPFHVMSVLFMNIRFEQNLFLCLLLLDLDWLAPRRAEGERPVIFYDGVCGLCNGFVRWVTARDRIKVFQFVPIQDPAARDAVGPLHPDPMTWSIFLKDEQGLHRRSDAVLRIVGRFGGVWVLARTFYIIPRGLRDLAYDFVASRRYQWFGKEEAACPIGSGAGTLVP